MARLLSFVGALCASVGLFASTAADATDLSVVGLSPPNRAIVMINGSGPHVLTVDQTVESVRLVSVSAESAEFIVDGRHRTVALGSFVGSSNTSGPAQASLTADARGHFVTQGQVNGATLTFLVDTGATLVTLSAADAARAGVDYQKGPVQVANTANGTVQFHLVYLDTVKVGDIELHNVQAAVESGNLATGALLGMSFLQRTNMSREGSSLVLTRRF